MNSQTRAAIIGLTLAGYLLLALATGVGVTLLDKGRLGGVTEVRESNVFSVSCSGQGRRICDVYLSKSIVESQKYQSLYKLLNNAQEGDEVHVHLHGNGGNAETLYRLYYTMKKSQARIVTILEGDVYSAHAFLLLAGDEIRIVNPSALILFHRSSIYGQDPEVLCAPHQGKFDRTYSAYDKCLNMVAKLVERDQLFTVKVLRPYLSRDQLLQVLDGDDVVVFWHQLRQAP